MSNPNLDAGIPLLTEVITPSDENEVVNERNADAPKPAPQPPKEEPASTKTPSLNGMTAEQLSRVEDAVAERVLAQMLGQIDQVLEQRVRDSLADVLQIAVEGLAAEIRQGLQATLEGVITRAVSQEIARLKETKN